MPQRYSIQRGFTALDIGCAWRVARVARITIGAAILFTFDYRFRLARARALLPVAPQHPEH